MTELTPLSNSMCEYIPIVGTQRTGPPKDFIRAGYPDRFADMFCKIRREGDMYALRLDENVHHWIDGDLLILDPNKKTANLKAGSELHTEVYLRTNDHSHEGIFCIVNWISETWEIAWVVKSDLEPNKHIHIPVDEIAVLHPIVGVVYSGLESVLQKNPDTKHRRATA